MLVSYTISGYGTLCLFIPLPHHHTPLLLRGFRADRAVRDYRSSRDRKERIHWGLGTMSELKPMPSTSSWRWIPQGWDGSYQPRSPPHWHPPGLMGVSRAPFQLPSASGAVDTCQGARAGGCLGHLPFLSVRFRSSAWSGAELRKFVSEAPLGLPHAKHPSQKHGAATSF